MPAANLFIHSIRDATIVEINERTLIDPYRIQQVAADLYELVEIRGERKLILDLTKVHQVAPAFITVLLNLRAKSAENKGAVVLCGLQPEVRKLAKIADLHKSFKCYHDEEGALRAFGLTTAG